MGGSITGRQHANYANPSFQSGVINLRTVSDYRRIISFFHCTPDNFLERLLIASPTPCVNKYRATSCFQISSCLMVLWLACQTHIHTYIRKLSTINISYISILFFCLIFLSSPLVAFMADIYLN